MPLNTAVTLSEVVSCMWASNPSMGQEEPPRGMSTAKSSSSSSLLLLLLLLLLLFIIIIIIARHNLASWCFVFDISVVESFPQIFIVL